MPHQDTEKNPDKLLDNVETSAIQPPELESYSNDAKNNKLPIALFILVILIIGVTAIVVLGRSKTVEAPTNNTIQTTNQSEEFSSPVGGELNDKLTFEPFETNGPGVYTYYEPTRRFLAVPVVEDISYTASITQKNPALPVSVDTVRTYFYADLRDAGFEDYVEPNETIGQYDNQAKTIALKKGDVVCKLNVSGVEDVAASVEQYCADMSQVSVVAENMEKFYDAYESSDEDVASNYSAPYVISLNENEVKDSEIAGYQYVYGGIGFFDYTGANVTFVRATGDDWLFFVGRQDILDCNKYSEVLFQKALAHETCYIPSNDTQVLVKEFYTL